MASRQRKSPGKVSKTWRARVSILGVRYYLGSYPTKKEAEKVEEAFRKEQHTEEYFDIRRAKIKMAAQLRSTTMLEKSSRKKQGV